MDDLEKLRGQIRFCSQKHGPEIKFAQEDCVELMDIAHLTFKLLTSEEGYSATEISKGFTTGEAIVFETILVIMIHLYKLILEEIKSISPVLAENTLSNKEA